MAKKQDSLRNLFNALDKAQGKDVTLQIPLPVADISKMDLSAPQRAILDTKESINLFLAGQGAGKTFCMGVVSGELISNNPRQKGLIAANTYSQLSGSTLFRIREVWRDYFGWHEYNEYTKKGHYTVGVQPPLEFDTSTHNFDSYKNIISFCNGTVVHYHSLDNYKPIDGIEISWALLDETKDTKPEAITEVILGRLRQVNTEDKNKLYIFSSPSKSSFLNTFFNLDAFETLIQSSIYEEGDFFKQKTAENKFVVISSALHNLKNLPKGFIDRQKSILPAHLHSMLIFGNPFAKSGGEFYKCFDRALHVGKCVYDASIALHITFDFNVNPYITLCIWQIIGKKCMQIGEICLESPRNNTAAACKEFKRIYQGHEAGLFVYGDPAGKHQDTRNQKGYNDYTIIQSQLKDFKPIFRVAPKAPAVVMRANFINSILEQKLFGIEICINENCKETIKDYTFIKEAADGTKYKEKTQKNGITFEKYGHPSDANDYFLCEAFKAEFSRYLRGDTESKPWLFGLFKKNAHR
jgi:hypothetical protein